MKIINLIKFEISIKGSAIHYLLTLNASEILLKTEKSIALIEDVLNRTGDTSLIDGIGRTPLEIASEYNLKVVSDSAQAPGSLYKNRFTADSC